jgi:hypothetical protein
MRHLWIWGPVVAYVALIFYLSGLSDIRWSAPYPDHLLHAAEFFGLAILVARALNGGLQQPIPPRTMLLAFLYRYADLGDVLSDAVGAAIGLVGLHFMQRMMLRRHVT